MNSTALSVNVRAYLYLRERDSTDIKVEGIFAEPNQASPGVTTIDRELPADLEVERCVRDIAKYHRWDTLLGQGICVDGIYES